MEALWEYDLPHIGVMFKKIRSRREQNQSNFASLAYIDNSVISKFEKGGVKGNGHTFKGYVRALEELPPPHCITSRQAKMLLRLHAHSLKRKEREREASALSFDDITSPRLRPEFKALLTGLRQEEGPALIADSFWFVHAINGALLRMFGLNPDSELLYSWEGWHSMATKFREDSSVRRAYENTDEYLGPSVNQFFMDESVQRFLFTYQMRMLLHRIVQLSEKNNYKFTKLWSNSVTLDLDYELTSLSRTHWFEDQPILTDTRPRFQANVNVTPYHKATYTLVGWDPLGKEAEKVFEFLRAQPGSQDIFFAAEYDKNRDFHVNNWPEIQDWWAAKHPRKVALQPMVAAA